MDRTVDGESPARLRNSDERFACAVEVFRDAGLQSEGYSLLQGRADFEFLACDLDLQQEAPCSRTPTACARVTTPTSPSNFGIAGPEGQRRKREVISRRMRICGGVPRKREFAGTPGTWRLSGARYLFQRRATVRRSGRRTGQRPCCSTSIISLMRCRTASAECDSPPCTDGIDAEKKYFSSNTPRGVETYLFDVTRLTVDSVHLDRVRHGLEIERTKRSHA